jgi:hypothetical protein
MIEDLPAAGIEDSETARAQADPEQRPAAAPAGEEARDLVDRQAGVLGGVDGPRPAGPPARQPLGRAGPDLALASVVQRREAEHTRARQPGLHRPPFAVVARETAAVRRRPEDGSPRLPRLQQIHDRRKRDRWKRRPAPIRPPARGAVIGPGPEHRTLLRPDGEQSGDALAGKPGTAGDGYHRPGRAVPTGQPAFRAGPEHRARAVALRGQPEDLAGGQTRAGTEESPATVMQTGHAGGGEPRVAVGREQDVVDRVGLCPVRHVDRGPGASVVERRAVIRACPEQAPRIDREGEGGVLGQALLGAEEAEGRPPLRNRHRGGGCPGEQDRQGRCGEEADPRRARSHSGPS